MRVSAEFIRHEACPKCREIGKDTTGNNLGVWIDGHKYCFSCGYKESGDNLNIKLLTAKLLQPKEENKNDNISLPCDFTPNIPRLAIQWLKNYSITDADIEVNKIGWSQEHERLIFPVYDKYNNLLMWQGRDFSGKQGKKKYFTKGFPEKVFHILGDHDNKSVCVVEDIISCIKVSKVMSCMPLWGSIISTKRMLRLGDLFTNLAIWLDADKQEYATKRGIVAQPFFKNVFTIATICDPKVYTNTEIITLLWDFLKEK